MPPLFGTSTSYRLARIAALVVGSLLFLYACERSRSTMLSDVWVEILLAAAFGMAGIGAAWFEIMMDERSARNGNAAGSGLHYETGELVIRGRIARSGNLILHGRDLETDYEWSWTFRPAAFPAIRAALGDDGGDLLKLLENSIPQLDRNARCDPGAWLRAQDVAATYREKGDNPTEVTRELPVMKVGLPKTETPRASAGDSEQPRAGAAKRQRNAQSANDRASLERPQPRQRAQAAPQRTSARSEPASRSGADASATRSRSARPPLDQPAPSPRGGMREDSPRRNRRVQPDLPDSQDDSAPRNRRAQRDPSDSRDDSAPRNRRAQPESWEEPARRDRRAQPEMPQRADRSASLRRDRPARSESERLQPELPQRPDRSAPLRRDRPARSESERSARVASERAARSASERSARSASDRSARASSDRAVPAAAERSARRGQAVTDRPVQVPLNRLDAGRDYDEYDAPRPRSRRAR
ncbi:hypothetical protein AB0H76_05060 [Nocardia sp. NPDC050712]|uniref:hypothetical protein n=1 Tax=Nocardia sp. NPDC050712 TaxID=3155518 RepID=UPI0033E64E8B